MLCIALAGTETAYANDLVINVSPESSQVNVVKVLSEEEKAKQAHDKLGRKNKLTKTSDKESSWLGELFSDDKVVSLTPELDSDEEAILLNKDFLDPEESIVKSKKRWEQSVLKKMPDTIAPPYTFFNAKPSGALSERMYVDEREGKIYFLVKQGSLKGNITALMDETRSTKHLIWKIGNHKVFAEYWISGDSMFEVINNILTPYKQPDQVMFGVFLGSTIGIFYQADKEFWL
jgi:hypothetical protein